MKKHVNVCLFLLTAYLIAHFYLFLKITYIFHPGATAKIFLGLSLFIMFCSPMFIHLYVSRYPSTLSRALALISYHWVAVLILFFSTAVFFDLYNLIIRLIALLEQKDLSRVLISPLPAFFIPLFLAAVFSTYGYFEAKRLRVERLTVKTSKLPPGINKLTIAQISDLHLGIINRDKTLDKVIKKIEHLRPDLIVSTGDLLDAELNHIDHLSDKFKTLNARLGKFAVTGNHEFYGGPEHTLKFIENAGFTILRGRGITVDNVINIVGVDDPAWKNLKPENSVSESERETLSKLPPDIFTLLLKHMPDIDENSLGLFDLQLSGHTHKGQIFPINLAIKFFYKIISGYRKLSDGSAIYVSRGAGTAGPPVRFFAPPEITIIELVSDKRTL